MRWEDQRQSEHVEDVRDAAPGTRGPGGLRPGGRSLGLGSLVIALVAGWVFGINPLTVLGLLDGGGAGPGLSQGAPAGPPATAAAPQDRQGRFVSAVLADTEDVWTGVFRQAGRSYEPPTLVLYRDRWPTACGTGQAAMGPFYCPGDRKVYIDLSFYDTLQRELGAPGDFAQAYVIAHEVAHHVQNLMGLTERVDQMRGRSTNAQQNAMSVRLELQADCFAGVWAHHAQATRQNLEPGDLEEALNAASRIGDDALQQRAGGPVVAENFTHGSSAQRVRWFQRGMQTGRVADCDTFQARQL